MNLIATLRGDFGQVESAEITISPQQWADFFTCHLAPNCYMTTRREKAWEAVVRANWATLWPRIRDYRYPSDSLWYGDYRIVGLEARTISGESTDIFCFDAMRTGIPEFTHTAFELSSAARRLKR